MDKGFLSGIPDAIFGENRQHDICPQNLSKPDRTAKGICQKKGAGKFPTPLICRGPFSQFPTFLGRHRSICSRRTCTRRRFCRLHSIDIRQGRICTLFLFSDNTLHTCSRRTCTRRRSYRRHNTRISPPNKHIFRHPWDSRKCFRPQPGPRLLVRNNFPYAFGLSRKPTDFLRKRHSDRNRIGRPSPIPATTQTSMTRTHF